MYSWTHSHKKQWWAHLVTHVLHISKSLLIQGSLLVPMVAIKYEISPSYQHLWALLERFNPETCIFFTHVGELGMALHEMEEVSGYIMATFLIRSVYPQARSLISSPKRIMLYTVYTGRCFTTSLFVGMKKEKEIMASLTYLGPTIYSLELKIPVR